MESNYKKYKDRYKSVNLTLFKELHKKLELYAKAESKRVGYNLTIRDVLRNFVFKVTREIELPEEEDEAIPDERPNAGFELL